MLEGVAAFAFALILGTFVEYWGHRFMHRWLLRKRHALHHRDGHGQGWLGEFFDYSTGSLPLMLLGFFWSVEVGVGMTAGGLAYAAFAAYSHQLQHERPELCFWMKRPVHHIHHSQHLWHHNFGISVSLWDHVFGTYKKVDWAPRRLDPPPRLTDYVRINWLDGAWPWKERPARVTFAPSPLAGEGWGVCDAAQCNAMHPPTPPSPTGGEGANATQPAPPEPPSASPAAESPCPASPVPAMVRAEDPSSSPTT
jgi:hypothetical protein